MENKPILKNKLPWKQGIKRHIKYTLGLSFDFLQRDKQRPGETTEEQIGRILGQVGPSMMLSSFSESIAFFLGKQKFSILPMI